MLLAFKTLSLLVILPETVISAEPSTVIVFTVVSVGVNVLFPSILALIFELFCAYCISMSF